MISFCLLVIIFSAMNFNKVKWNKVLFSRHKLQGQIIC